MRERERYIYRLEEMNKMKDQTVRMISFDSKYEKDIMLVSLETTVVSRKIRNQSLLIDRFSRFTMDISLPPQCLITVLRK